MDPRAIKSMMSKMGISTSEIEAEKVVIYTRDKEIVINNPEITKIDTKGIVSFQIGGDIVENEREQEKVEIEISDDDVNLVSEKTGITDKDKVKEALEESNGDIAEAIIKLKSESD